MKCKCRKKGKLLERDVFRKMGKINIREQKWSMLIGIIVVLMSLFLGYIFIQENEALSRIDISGMDASIEAVEINIDEISIAENEFVISGWAFIEEPSVVDRMILLRNINDGSEVWAVNTMMVKRMELNDIYEGTAYKNAGFVASGKIKSKMKANEYEILIYINDKGENCIFNTNKSISF